MDFKKFLTMMAEAESTAEKDDKAEKAGKKVAKDIEYDDKKDKKKKSLKDWFEIVDRNMLSEAEQVTMEPAKQSTQVIKRGNEVIGSVTNPALAATIKQAIGKGEMSLAGHDMKEEAEDNPESAMLEKWAGDAEVKATGQYAGKSVEELKSMLAKLKKSGPHDINSPEAKKQRQINFALRAKGDWKKGEGAAMKEEQVDEKAKNPYAIGMAQAMKSAGDKPPLKKSTITKAHDIAKSIKKKTDEADIPKSGPDYGAGLGAGRSQATFESKNKKKVDEAMNTCEAAYHEGKAHGLTKHGYACRYDEGSEEHSHYHRGFKEGLDECYGLMPNRGLVVSEIESGADVVDNMASYGAEEGDLAEMDKTEYMKHKAKTTPGGTFKAFGQTFSDKEVLETDAFAFESLDKQLNDLLNEGLSVNMSQGLGGPGGDMEDTVSVTAQGDDAGKLLQFIKQVGLGGLGGGVEPIDGPAEPAVAVSDYGAPKFSGYDSEKGDMMGLLKVMSGGEDYKDEEGHDHGDMPEAKMCEVHGMAEAKCGCGEGKEMVDEVESEDQMEYQVAEDDGEGYEQGQEAAAQIDSALAVGSENEKAVHEGGDGMEGSPEAAGAVAAADADEEQEAAMSESSFLNLYKKIALISEESTAEKDDKAEKAAKKVAKDIEYDEGHKGKDDNKAEKAGEKVKKDIEYDDKKDKKEKVDEWANDAGKDGTQQTFERDIEFMTKVIAGGLNKPKSTGQQTIPVLAGDKERTGDEDMAEFRKLAGLGQ